MIHPKFHLENAKGDKQKSPITNIHLNQNHQEDKDESKSRIIREHQRQEEANS